MHACAIDAPRRVLSADTSIVAIARAILQLQSLARHLVVFSPKRRPANAGETAQPARVLPGWCCGSRCSRTPAPIATLKVPLESTCQARFNGVSPVGIAWGVPELQSLLGTGFRDGRPHFRLNGATRAVAASASHSRVQPYRHRCNRSGRSRATSRRTPARHLVVCTPKTTPSKRGRDSSACARPPGLVLRLSLLANARADCDA